MSDEQLFDLTPSEDQSLMGDTIRRFAESEMRQVSRDADEKGSTPDGFYDKVHELGFAMMSIPEAQGGMGEARSPVSNVLVAEELAQGDMSLAIGALAPLSVVNTLVDQGSAAQQEKYLPKFVEESFCPATIALKEPKATFNPTQLDTKAEKTASGFVLNGKKVMVPLGGSAELTIVIADLEGKPAAFLVDKGTKGVSTSDETHMGLRPLEMSTLTLDNVELPESALLGEQEKSFELSRLLDMSKIGMAAIAAGVCDAVLRYVSEYVTERKAFGEPIAQRQAVAFAVADMRIELDSMRLLTYRAASQAEQGKDFHREAYLAKVFASERAMQIGNQGVQMLGGHGYIREHMVELWYRNLRAVGILDACVAV